MSILDARLSALDARLSALDARLSAIETRLSALDAQPSALETRFKVERSPSPSPEPVALVRCSTDIKLSAEDKRGLTLLRDVIPLALWRWASRDGDSSVEVPLVWWCVFSEQRVSVWCKYVGDSDMRDSFEWQQLRRIRHDKGAKVTVS